MQELRDIFADSNLEVLIICEDPAKEQRAYLREHGIVVPAAFDPDGRFRDSLSIGASSSVLVVNANGRIVDTRSSIDESLRSLGVEENWPKKAIGRSEVQRLLKECLYLRLVELIHRELISEATIGIAVADREFRQFCSTVHQKEASRANHAMLMQWVFGQHLDQVGSELYSAAQIHGVSIKVANPGVALGVETEGFWLYPSNVVAFSRKRLARSIIMKAVSEKRHVPLRHLDEEVDEAMAAILLEHESHYGPVRQLLAKPPALDAQ